MWFVAVLLICCAFLLGTVAGVRMANNAMAEFMANLSKQFKEIAESELQISTSKEKRAANVKD